jgi:DNA-binding GntR family transcriptional regulator
VLAPEGAPVSLRDRIRRKIVEQIGRGEYQPGCRLNLARISGAMGVSPTPVREALTQLQHEGLVRSEPQRGFFVPEFSVQRLEETYPILGVLEGLAVRSIPTYPQRTIVALRAANAQLAATTADPLAAFEADLLWHTYVVERCRNKTLLDELTRLRQRIASCELAFMREAGNRPDSVAGHEKVASLLETGEHSRAAQALQSHWSRSTAFVRSRGDVL